jgi:hypothetical protein
MSTAMEIEGRLPTREMLAMRTRSRLQRGGLRSPDVLLVEMAGAFMVVKDFRPRPFWLRHTLGRWLIRRELRAYRALAGHPSVPHLFGRIDAFAFAMEYRPGVRIARSLAGRVPDDLPEALEKAVAAMHDRGVAHLDLRHRSNVLVDRDGAPVLLDFASAVCFRPGGLLARWLLPRFARMDLRALSKWRDRLLVRA